MAIKDVLLPEFDHEMAVTRTVLARVPAEKASWKPHPKSMSLGALAIHLAELSGFGAWVVELESFDFAPPGGPRYERQQFTTLERCLALFDENVRRTRQAISGTGDAALTVSWSLKSAGKPIFTIPRAAALRTFLLNHMIHHRGQLTVYLRLQDVPLPSVYGPTADEA